MSELVGRKRERFPVRGRLAQAVTIAALLACFMVPALAQEFGHKRVSLPHDWSSHHVLYTKSLTAEQLEKASRDPRFYHSWLLQGHAFGTGLHSHGGGAQPKPDWSFSLGSGTVALGMSPAKFNFLINATVTAANCTSDFAVYGLNVAGTTGGQANLVVLQNLYSGSAPTGLCGSAPTVKWAYNVTTVAGGTVTTSPAISEDGTKIAFIESTGTSAVLHVLRPKTSGTEGTVAASVAPATSTNVAATWTTCLAGTTSCMFNLTIGSNAITRSSPFVDYDNDIIYQANDNGQIFKVTGVFNGTPALATTGGWAAAGVAITGAAGTVMTSPVLDNASGYIFLGSSNGTAYAVQASAPGTQSSMTVGCGSTCGTGVAGKGAIFDGPVVDSTNGTVFFSASDNAAGVGDTTIDRVAVVVQATTTPTLFGSKTVAVLGEGMGGSANANINYVHTGTFDQAYFNWTGSGNNAGHYFACGTPTAARTPVLYAIPFATGAGGATINPGAYTNGSRAPSANLIGSTTPLATNGHEDCTPMAEIYNGTNDFLFFGLGTVNGTGDAEVAEYTGTGAGGAFTNAIIQGAPTHTITEPNAQGGTSATVVDNVSTQAQAASIYFATLATSNNCGTATYCAVKVTQSALQ